MSNNSTKSHRNAKVADGSGGVQSVDRAISVLEILARAARPASARWPPRSTCTSRPRSGCWAPWRRAAWWSRPASAASTGSASACCGWPARSPAAWTSSAGPPGLRASWPRRSARRSTSRCCSDHYAVNLDQVRGPAAVTAHNWVGQLTPLHATSSGKVLLAHLPAGGARRPARRGRPEARFTPHTITARKTKLEQKLADGSRRATPTTLEEYEDGLNAMAAPGARPAPARWSRRPERLGARLPAGQERMQDLLRAAQGRRGAARGPDGPPAAGRRPARPVRRRGPAWACTQSWNSPMWCSLGTRTPPLRVDPGAHGRLAPLAGLEVLPVDPVEQLDRAR